MLVYALVWMVPALSALAPLRAGPRAKNLLFLAAGIFLCLFIGLRHEVGADWYNYLAINHSVSIAPGASYLLLTDPAYAVAARLAGDGPDAVYIANSVCATFFVVGAMRFCRDQPLPSLAICITLSYLGIVVAMGYTRQSAAIGLIMWGLVSLRRGRPVAYGVATVLASLFHRTALVALPLTLIMIAARRRLQVALVLALPGVILAFVFLAVIQSQFDLYGSGEVRSDGGLIRAIMNAIPAIVFFFFRRRYAARWPDDAMLWKWPAVVALVLLPLLPFASTVVDRVGLYLVPLQIAVMSRLPLLCRGERRAIAFVGVLAGYGGVLVIWLTTSFFARCCWIPYRWVL